MIAKRRGSPYEHRRSKHWLKMKCEASQELVVGGFTDPQGARVGLGALLVGYYQGDDLVFAGKVGTGFDTKLLLDLRKRLDAIELPTSPFTKANGLPRVRAHWARPEIVVQVAFIEWTAHGKLRHPRLIGVRFDKNAREVVREQLVISAGLLRQTSQRGERPACQNRARAATALRCRCQRSSSGPYSLKYYQFDAPGCDSSSGSVSAPCCSAGCSDESCARGRRRT